MVQPEYVLAGAAVGFIVGLTGVGGGALMTPLLVLGFGIPPATAIGTDLAYAALTKSGGAVAYARRRLIAWELVARLAAGSLPAVVLTLLALKLFVTETGDLGALLTPALGVMLTLSALVVLAGDRLRLAAPGGLPRGPILIAAGALLGVAVTLSSVGAGALGAALLFLLYPEQPAARVVGSDLAHAVPLTALAALGHSQLGTIDFELLLALLLGSLPAVQFASRLASRLPQVPLKRVLGLLLLVIGLRFAF